ncbi:MAG: bifunctional hydroxymethylpyrimidine kinase/phosphomethylpyrimidine kinase [Actinomycetota bacterium]
MGALFVIALTVAGFDPSSGAGISQDLRTFSVCGVWGTAVISALTVQDTTGVISVHPTDPAIIRAQLIRLSGDMRIGAAKTGMLATAAIVETVARALVDARIEDVVVDPAMIAGANDTTLLDDEGVEAMRSVLLPIATLVTPNAVEAEALTGFPVRTVDQQSEAARAICAMGARAALVKGGHVEGERAIDILCFDGKLIELSAPRVVMRNVHGTGCTLSAAITAGLAKGQRLETAVREAKGVVTRSIENAFYGGAGDPASNPTIRTGPWELAGHPFE